MAANSTKVPGASQSPLGASLHAQAAKPPQNDDNPRSAEFAPSKPPSGLTERPENRSFNGAAKPRPTRNFRAADFISSLNRGSAPVPSIVSSSVRRFASTAAAPSASRVGVAFAKRRQRRRGKGHHAPAEGSVRGQAASSRFFNPRPSQPTAGRNGRFRSGRDRGPVVPYSTRRVCSIGR